MNNLNVAKIQLNGSPYEINTDSNLSELLNKLKIQKNKIAIELNGVILPKQLYGKKKIKDRDKIEIVQFIGGG